MLNKLKLFILVICGCLLLPFAAKAVTISPLIINLSGDPGQTAASELMLYNEGDAEIIISSQVETFQPKGENGEAEIVPADVSNQAIAWVKLPFKSTTLKPKQQIRVPLSVNIPSTADVGGYYLAVMFAAKNSDSGSGPVAISSRVGALVFLTVNGSATEDLQLREFKHAAQKLSAPLPLEFSVRLENQGNIHLQPQGFIIIRDVFGRIAKTLPFNADGGRLLPGSFRSWQVSLPAEEKTSAKFPWPALAQEWDNFYLGPYTAVLDISYGETQKKLTSLPVTFWMIPVRILSLIFIFILVLIVVKLFLIKKK